MAIRFIQDPIIKQDNPSTNGPMPEAACKSCHSNGGCGYYKCSSSLNDVETIIKDGPPKSSKPNLKA